MLSLLQKQRPRRPPRSFTSSLQHLGALGLFFLAILDSSPIPTFGAPDILTAVLSASHRDPWYEYAATATAGSVIGAYITFRLARKAGSAYLDKKFEKGKVSKLLQVFKKWGTGTLVATTLIPLPSPTTMFFAAAGASPFPAQSAIQPSPWWQTTTVATSSAPSAIPRNTGAGCCWLSR